MNDSLGIILKNLFSLINLSIYSFLPPAFYLINHFCDFSFPMPWLLNFTFEDFVITLRSQYQRR